MRSRALIAMALLAALPGCRNPSLPEGGTGDRDVAAGQRIFLRKCASCHNSNGDGHTIVAGHFPNANLIDGIWRSDGSAAAIERQIRRGHDPMPKFEGKLTDEEIRQTVVYVRALSAAAEARNARRAAASP